MDHHPCPSMVFFFMMVIILGYVHVPSSVSAIEEKYLSCSTTFQCAHIKNISYPFWGSSRSEYCGYPGFELDCDGDVPEITIADMSYRVLDIDSHSRALTVAREDYWYDNCPSDLVNTTINSSLFDYTSTTQNITLYYRCHVTSKISTELLPYQFNCSSDETNTINYYLIWNDKTMGSTCSDKVIVPVLHSTVVSISSLGNLSEAIAHGFELQWYANNSLCEKCEGSGGKCGYNTSSNEFTCYCPDSDKPYPTTCPTNRTSTENKIILPVGGVIGIAAGAAVIFLGGFFFLIIYRRRKIAAQSESRGIETPPSPSTNSTTNLSKSVPSRLFSKSDLEKGSSYFGAQVFSYTELQQATHNFHSSKELGDGGFGIVYYGVLNDGRVVAVKRLFEKNFKRVEQFMNEVEILTRIRHPNLVTLYGCTSRHSRELLLVYEYIPNGTVADHLHGRNSNSGLLPWHVRLSIAIDTAAALAYLHASDIIHRDVKTNNILLDSNFNVKVADFGLSRLFPTDVTHVSTAPQGTPGYVDPEYHQCYQLTDKSDVYSFGVVLIELISSLQAVDTNRHRHDINLANMATSRIQNNALNELVDPCIGFEKDFVVRNMVTSVAELAFRCLQQDREMRPCMDEVLEVLKGIENQKFGAEKAEVVDIRSTETDEVGLLKNIPVPPPLSPVSSSTATDSF